MIQEFIKKHLDGYMEPERKGTPKGEPIGFDKRKIHACLLTALTSFDLKRVSDESGIPYGSLRVMKTQDDYKGKEIEFREMFGELFCKKFMEGERLEKLVEIFKGLNRDLMREIHEKLPSEIEYFYRRNELRKIMDREEDKITVTKNGARKIIEAIEKGKKDVVIDIFKKSSE